MGTFDDLARGVSIRFRVDKSEYRSIDASMFYGEIALSCRFRDLEVWKATVRKLNDFRSFEDGAKEEVLDAMIEEVQQLEERVKTLLQEIKTKDLAIKAKDDKIVWLESAIAGLKAAYVEPLEALLR